ncbi:MAG: ATP-dependent DNA ligase [Woeseiaceae bacterium]|nr:ATP-dependent DNA ligase [Woeseiaceae bacterium]
MNLNDLVNVSSAVSATRSRLKKRALLGDCLRAADTNEVRLVVNYLAGVMPQGRIGLGPAMVSAALKNAETGDNALALTEIDRRLADIAAMKGAGSKQAKTDAFGQLLSQVTSEEQRFLAGLVLGEVRQGALEGVLIEGIAEASELPADAIRRAVMLAADPAPVAEAALVDGLPGLQAFRLQVLNPVRPMLAQPSDTLAEAMDGLGEAALQYKLDGARIQVHRAGADVRIFTRQLHDVTARLPEITEAALEMPAREFILDGEAIAFGKDERPLPFQVTMRRFGRSSNVEEMRDKLPLSGLHFDCLYLDGDELIDRSFDERSAALAGIADAQALVPQLTTANVTEASRFLAAALEQGHEGIMAKSPGSLYAAGNRGSDWLKIKQAHTLDLVILAAEWGSGRRKGWLSNLHLGARNPDDGSFVMLGKTFKGLTDKMLAEQTKALLDRELGRDGNVVHVRPELVVEIAVNDIQESRQYPAGMALRFARVKRYRSDKRASEADTIDTVRQLFDEARR